MNIEFYYWHTTHTQAFSSSYADINNESLIHKYNAQSGKDKPIRSLFFFVFWIDVFLPHKYIELLALSSRGWWFSWRIVEKNSRKWERQRGNHQSLLIYLRFSVFPLFSHLLFKQTSNRNSDYSIYVKNIIFFRFFFLILSQNWFSP